MRRAFISVLVMIGLSGMIPIIGVAATINVPADYATIQAGIDAAVAGDTVLVAPGIYTGDGNRDIDFGGKNIMLMSSSGAETTIIDCQADALDQHSAFILSSGEDSTAVIDGFTIFRAYSSNGAIRINGSAWNNIVTSATIRNCIIDGYATPVTYHVGAIFINNNASPLIANCLIRNSNASGIMVQYECRVRIRDCIISLNWTQGIYIFESEADIVNCTIVRNKLEGVYHEGRYEKAVLGTGEDTVNISNSIVAFNVASSLGFGHGMQPTWIFQCSDFYGNGGGNYSGSGGSTYFQLVNVISANPLFCSEGSYNYSLAAASPCVPANNSCGILMGARPVGCEHICGDINGDNKVSLLDVSYLLNHLYQYLHPEMDQWAADVNADGKHNLSDISYLINFLYRNGPRPICP
jgi:hypothetical protein